MGDVLSLSGAEDDLQIVWRDWTPLAVTVDRRTTRISMAEVSGGREETLKLRARWSPGELTLTRKLDGVTVIEHILPPSGDRMVVVVEVQASGQPTAWFRREYVPESM